MLHLRYQLVERHVLQRRDIRFWQFELFQFQAKYLGHCLGAATPDQRHLNLGFHPISARHNLVEGEERCIIADAHTNDRMISDNPRIERLRSEEHTSELQSLMRISYAVCCLNKQT